MRRSERSLLSPLALFALVALLALIATVQACDPCAGTPSCHVPPAVSLGGRFIEHRTGQPVAGVRVQFVRRSGDLLARDTLVAVTDADGYFDLRGTGFDVGHVVRQVKGSLTVTPPAPFPPYTIETLSLRTFRVRGDGTYAGQFVVDPYYLLVGEVRDRRSLALIPGARVTVERTGGVNAQPDTFTATAAADGRFFRELRMRDAGVMDGTAIVEAPGYSRAFRIPLHLHARYLDQPGTAVEVLKLGHAIQYVAEILRRGTRKYVPGVVVHFRRTGGIRVMPEAFTDSVPEDGVIELMPEPLEDGVLYAEVTIVPPAPYPVEVLRDVPLVSQDADSLRVFRWGFGAQIFAEMNLVYRYNGAPVEEGIQVGLYRRGGLGIEPNGQLSLVDSLHRFRYFAATGDTGIVIADAVVHLRWPFDYDTIPALVIPARYDSLPSQFPAHGVGRWLPWTGTLLDARTDAPIAGARVEFRRTAGVALAPATPVTSSDANGRFRVRALPLRDGEVTGDLAISFADTWRDTTITGVRLGTSKDDTVRYLAPVRVGLRTP